MTTEFQDVPEGCVATILSRTTPLDVCRLSLVSKPFYSASLSDDLWNRFIPSDVESILSQSDSHSSLIANSTSKKALYLALSDQPILFDEGKKSFQLDRKSGKKHYMLSARALTIVWGDTPYYWEWTTLAESRFPEVAVLLLVCWLEIRGVINTLALSPNTHYAAYLVFKLDDEHEETGFYNLPVELRVEHRGEIRIKTVSLDPDFGLDPDLEEEQSGVNLPRPSVRSDGWLEIEMGEFFNPGIEDEQVELSVWEIWRGNGKRGLIVEGIQVRPKEDN